jgi:hypothetical protein
MPSTFLTPKACNHKGAGSQYTRVDARGTLSSRAQAQGQCQQNSQTRWLGWEPPPEAPCWHSRKPNHSPAQQQGNAPPPPAPEACSPSPPAPARWPCCPPNRRPQHASWPPRACKSVRCRLRPGPRRTALPAWLACSTTPCWNAVCLATIHFAPPSPQQQRSGGTIRSET